VLEGGFLEGPITDYQTVCANFIRFEIDGKQITGTVAMIDQQRPVCVINLAPPMSRKIRAREKKGGSAPKMSHTWNLAFGLT
jgi:hypothetical protein